MTSTFDENRCAFPAQILSDCGRRLKALKFDRFGNVLFGLCEPVQPIVNRSNSSSSLNDEVSTSPRYKSRRLDVVKLSILGGAQITVCKKLRLDASCSASCSSNDVDTAYDVIAATSEIMTARLRDLAYNSSQDRRCVFGVVYCKDVVKYSSNTMNQLCDGLTSTVVVGRQTTKMTTTSSSRRFLMTIDVENECHVNIYEICEEKGGKKLGKSSQFKLLHLNESINCWVLVEIEFDTENGCEFMTFYRLELDQSQRKATAHEFMRYSIDHYYVALNAQGSKIFMFKTGSKEVTVYDAAQDSFLSSVCMPILSDHIFELGHYVYMLPHFWTDEDQQRHRPVVMTTFDHFGGLQHSLTSHDDSSCKILRLCINNKGECWPKTDVDLQLKARQFQGSTKDVWVTGSNCGYMVIGSFNRMSSSCKESTNFYLIYETKTKGKNAKALRHLAFESVAKYYTSEYIIDYGLPDPIFREYVGPLWLRSTTADSHGESEMVTSF